MASTPMPLHITHYNATTKSTMAPIVLLHGWGFASESWLPILPSLQKIADVWVVDLPGFGKTTDFTQFSADEIIASLERQLPVQSCLVGWSLGGMLAVKYAANFPARVSKLVTLASNLCFVKKEHWPWAMPKKINQAFNRQFESSPELTLNTFYGLVSQGSDQERQLNKKFRRLQRSHTINDSWQQALEYLGVQDNCTEFTSLNMPGLHLFAEKDALIPMLAAGKVAELNGTQKVKVIDNVCHALHWDKPELIVDELNYFLADKKHGIGQRNKKLVARSFSRAATTYDSVAYFQREVGQNLLSKFFNKTPTNALQVLDLGVGTGQLLSDLRAHNPKANVIALDLAQGMLQEARKKHGQTAQWVCGDAESLPFMDNTFDLIFSNLALQWCEDLPTLFAGLKRMLKPGGRLVFSTLNKGTLRELTEAWQCVNSYVHVNQFPDLKLVHQAIERAGFSSFRSFSQTHPLYYESFLDIARELKALGAHNVNAGRPEGLTTRAQLKQLMAAYEKHRTAKGLALTYEVVYLEVIRGEHD